MFGIGEFLQRFKVETKDLSEQEKFLILRKKTKTDKKYVTIVFVCQKSTFDLFFVCSIMPPFLYNTLSMKTVFYFVI